MNALAEIKSPSLKLYNDKDDDVPPKPFIKWVGGKRQLLPLLKQNLPKQFDNYIEPFVGGGALLWTLNKDSLKNIVINDYNSELANLYMIIRDKPDALIHQLKKHINTPLYYYMIRGMDRENNYNKLSPIFKASRFIYLNKTGYNGLYRVNSKGQNNVPFGHYKNPKILDADTILSCSSFLKHVEILNGDFEAISPYLNENSFVYLDPPYAPLTATSNFTNYTDKGFDGIAQHRLKRYCDYIDSLGAKFMLSNSSAPLILDLYKDYNIEIVKARRAVNCKPDGRGEVDEVIIRNYL